MSFFYTFLINHIELYIFLMFCERITYISIKPPYINFIYRTFIENVCYTTFLCLSYILEKKYKKSIDKIKIKLYNDNIKILSCLWTFKHQDNTKVRVN